MKKVFKRTIEDQIEKSLFKGKIIIIYGPRQAGKTTLVKKLVEEYKGTYFLCEEPDVFEALSNKTSTHMKQFLGSSNFIVLDEAQKIPNIGTSLKLLIDNYPDIQIIATGSSSFDLANKVNEPLTGRNFEFHLYPLSINEIVGAYGLHETKRLLESLLIYGMYPEIVVENNLREERLRAITNDYLYKDILSYEGIRKPILLQNILKALALQVGSQVSYSEVSRIVGASRQTVMSYIDILEKAFVIFRLRPLTKNMRDEIKHMHKIYFYDVGVLNTLINNYNPLSIRNDSGKIFENFFIAEKIKQQSYGKQVRQSYFWRTKDGQEIDLVVEHGSTKIYHAYECKLTKTNSKLPNIFKETYSTEEYTVVSKEKLVDIIIKDTDD